MLIDSAHVLNDSYSTVITVETGRDSVDIKLINIAKSGDIVVTGDYGVAAMALGRGCKAINQNGMIYSSENMDRLLFERFLGQEMRRQKRSNPKGSKKRTNEDNEKFTQAFLSLLDK